MIHFILKTLLSEVERPKNKIEESYYYELSIHQRITAKAMILEHYMVPKGGDHSRLIDALDAHKAFSDRYGYKAAIHSFIQFLRNGQH